MSVNVSERSGTIHRESILEMESRIRPWIRTTPVLETDRGDFGLGSGAVALKLELFQHGGSFKTRGAFANLLTRAIPKAGVVAASGGNHGAAVAHAANRLGIPAKIFVPTVSSPAKVARIRESGADLTVIGERYADALEASERWARETGAMPVHAFDQRETLLGQGTIGLELESQSRIDTVLAPVGGGSIVGGLSAWYGGAVRIVAVEPEGAPTLTRALEAGRPVDAPTDGIAADSLAPRRVGEIVFPIVRAFVDRVLLVTDEEIVAAQRALWSVARIAAEPGGAAAFAALLARRYEPAPGERVGVIVSGGNTTAVSFSS